jgi:glycosyltransferase involved in cell wall biosynthesis
MGHKSLFGQLTARRGSGVSQEAAKLRGGGDSFRDQGRFLEAAQAYEAYLKFHPDDFSIWVQRGNCLKDAGDYASANAAYEAAIALRPNDPDVHVQLGHLMKLQGRKALAASCYRRANDLDPSFAPASVELKALGLRMRDLEATNDRELPGKKIRAFDISDLLAFLRHNTRVTGIQRVQSCLISELLQNGESGDITLVYHDQASQRVCAIEAVEVLQLINMTAHRDITQAEIHEQVCRICDAATSLKLRQDDTLVILGAYWIGGDYATLLLGLHRRGVRIGVYVYDLIPITHPQFVSSATRKEVQDRFLDVMSIVDFVLTISKYVANEVSIIVRNELRRDLPVLPVLLAHELPVKAENAGALAQSFAVAIPEKYALCVCTLEGRKNHLLLLQAWTSLARKHDGDIPHLILVGKWGWRIRDFKRRLEATNYANGKIMVLSGLADEELEQLYRGCMFTLFPSFVEGWGLPVGESLAYGKPCIASSTSSMPEVGGDFVRYIDPHDPISAIEEIEQALFDKEYLAKWTRRVANDFVIRRWADVAEDFVAKLALAEARCQLSPRRALNLLEPGQVYEMTRPSLDNASQDFLRQRMVQFICAEGWLPPHQSGRWSSGRHARLIIATRLSIATPVKVWLRLCPPEISDRGFVLLKDKSGRSKAVRFDTAGSGWNLFETVTEEGGAITLLLERVGSISHSESTAHAFIGLGGVGYHAVEDLDARLSIIETILTTSPISGSSPAEWPAAEQD